MSREPGNLPCAVVLLSVGVRRELRCYRGDDSWSRYCETHMPSRVHCYCEPVTGYGARRRIVAAGLRVEL